MASNYSVQINMSPNTVSSLKSAGYSLYGFKAIKTSIQGGVPLVWFATKNYLVSTNVGWQEDYQAYISTTTIAPNTKIVSSNAAGVDLGDTMTVDPSGNVLVTTDGTPGAISIVNASSVPYTCGISQEQNGSFTPMCAFPLFGNMLDQMMPVEKVLFMFATNQVDTGTVIYRAYSQGLTVNLTGTTSRTVSFDINTGWSADGAAWASLVPPNADMLPILITH
ncbi:hypothetical protein [Oleisolibacter albus]|uniref:hypothetical protein n=1 Tax=Oleisolibacter albus TaxID=2171757 RepID=UPI000DF3E0D4|nr:hypothetical protein [Oleisolibacter albus]